MTKVAAHWEAAKRAMQAEARKRVPLEEREDAVAAGLEAAVRWAQREGRAPTPEEARSILGGAWSSRRNTLARRKNAGQVEFKPASAPRKRRAQPSRGRPARDPKELVALAKAAATEILLARIRGLQRSLHHVQRMSTSRTAELDGAALKSLGKLIARVNRHTSATNRSRREQFLTSAEYVGFTPTEQAALLILVDIEVPTGETGTGREAVREVMQSVRQWRRRRPLLPFGGRVHS